MKKLLSLIGATIIGAVIITGCGTTGQRTAANTIESEQAVADSTVAGYYDGVLQGILTTNDVPTVSRSYNAFNASVRLEIELAQNNTNALAPANLTTEFNGLVTLVKSVSKAAK